MFANITVIVVLAIVASFVVFGWRKKHFSDLDKLELKKIELMNSPVLEEVSRVRELNMDGETEKSFGRWRKEWEEIVTVEFPKMEEYFFNCEEQIAGFRFKKANETKGKIISMLDNVEESIEQIFSELRHLLELAEENEVALDEIREDLKEIKKHIIIHNHSFGNSITTLEEEIDGCLMESDKVQTLSACGDYFEAKAKLESLEEMRDLIKGKTKVIPNLLSDASKNLPETIRLLKKAYAEMENEGFPLTSFEIDKVIEGFDVEIGKITLLIENAKIEGVQESINKINEEIDKICEKLDKERVAREYLQENKSQINSLLSEQRKSFEQIKRHTDAAASKYKIPDLVENGINDLNFKFPEIIDEWEMIKEQLALKKEMFSKLKTQAIEIEKDLNVINSNMIEYLEHIAALGVDERATIKKVEVLRMQYAEINVKIKLANLPGIPNRYATLNDDAKSSIEEVWSRLQDVPLNMTGIFTALEEATRKISNLENITDELVEDMKYAEKVIVYGNRYRISNPELALELQKSEEKFRMFAFSESLEIASLAIEKVEPGFFKNLKQSEAEQTVEKNTDEEKNSEVENTMELNREENSEE